MMKRVHIRDKLVELGVTLGDINMGHFDSIGEITARKNRDPNSPLFKTAGAHFRPNYERGILIDALVKHFKLSSMLEIGYGRGYGTFCAASAFHDLGAGEVTTIDPALRREIIEPLTRVFPSEWFTRIKFVEGKSQNVLPTLDKKAYDLVYIDGDHTYDAVRRDWELAKELEPRFVLFDDYHLPTKDSGPGIEVARVVDEIDGVTSKELIIMDRRIFNDDRGIADDDIDYGQVLIEV